MFAYKIPFISNPSSLAWQPVFHFFVPEKASFDKLYVRRLVPASSAEMGRSDGMSGQQTGAWNVVEAVFLSNSWNLMLG